MKPTRGRVYCKESGKRRLWFENEKKANLFIKFNSEDIEAESGYAPTRTYYCLCCDGWHLTSKPEDKHLKSRSEWMTQKYKQDKEKRALAKAKAKELKKELGPELKRQLDNVKCMIDNAREFLKSSNLTECSEILKRAYDELIISYGLIAQQKN